MGTHFLSKQRRTHNERKETLEILGLGENSGSTIIGRFDMEFMQTSNGKHGRALPRKQALGVLLCRLWEIQLNILSSCWGVARHSHLDFGDELEVLNVDFDFIS